MTVPNHRRGEVAATIAGAPWTLCLTLGGLAELEAAFGVGDLSALGDRFGSGRLGTADLLRIAAIGLKGGGHPVTEAVLADWPAASLPEVADAVAALLAATFGDIRRPPAEPRDA